MIFATRNLKKKWHRSLAIVPILAFIALGAWAFASPVGASPDDDFHLASIWCGSGTHDGLCDSAPQADSRMVPPFLGPATTCFVGKPDVSAACQSEAYHTLSSGFIETNRGNFTGTYPPVYYFTLSLFASPQVEVSVLAMRAFNSALFVGLMTALVLLLPARRRSSVVAALVTTLVPLGMFLIPSTNPSSWAILSAGIVTFSLVGYFESTGARRFGLAALATLGALIGAGARADAAIYVIIGSVAASLLTFERTRRFARAAVLPALLSLGAFAFFAFSGQSAAGTTGLNSGSGTGTTGGLHLGLALSNLVNLPDLWVGVFGSWALGWFDTALPTLVWSAGFAAFVSAVIVGLRLRSTRKSLATTVLAVSLVVIPFATLAATGALVGTYVQPRYVLPLVVIFALCAFHSVDRSKMRLTPTHVWWLAGVATAGNSLSLYTNIRRYATGTSSRALDLVTAHGWWWNIPVSPLGVWFIGSVAFAVALIILAKHFNTMDATTPALR